MRVGILDLLTDRRLSTGLERLYAHYFRRQFIGLMPQVVSVWCRQLGHDVHYATYFGQADPRSLLPRELDMVFVSSFTQQSALAYALAKLFRAEGVRTILGGPHARAFSLDALRFFDIVVRHCDRELVDDILRGRVDPPAIVDAGRTLAELPPVEERLKEISISAFHRGRPTATSVVPMLSSVGCPYRCDFCIDWNTDYRPLSADRLRADLAFLAEHYPSVLVGYHDPNFGVRFDDTLDAIEALPMERRNRYIMESSLSILKPERLKRLAETNCAYVAPGIESWTEYSNKAGAQGRSGEDKLAKVVAHMREIERFIPGIQANFLFGGDGDAGDAPAELTIRFIRALPGVFPTVNIPTPFGGTPLFDQLRREGRILEEMPFALYYNPYLTITPAHYDPVTYYRHLIDICRAVTSALMLGRRMLTSTRTVLRLIHAVRTFGVLQEERAFRRLHAKLTGDRAFRAFHEGRGGPLPALYRAIIAERLGAYASLLEPHELRPILDQEEAPPAPGPLAGPLEIAAALPR